MELNRALADQALANYPLDVCEVTPLRQSENLTWQVETYSHKRYLLRVHRASTAVLAGTRQQPAAIRSELTWLAALGQTGLEVQQPIHTHEGDLLAWVDLPGGLACCTVLTWLEGDPFKPEVHMNAVVIRSFARMTAALHAHAATWMPPPGFTRPPQDAAHFARLFALLEKGVDSGVITPADWQVIHRTTSRLVELLAFSEGIPGMWGLIHADLHSGNLLVRGEQVLPIDFSLCGFSSFFFDLSIALTAAIAPAWRGEFLREYRAVRPFGDEYLPLLDSFGLVGMFGYCAFQIDNPSSQNWFRHRIPRLAAEECQKFLTGELVYLSDSAA